MIAMQTNEEGTERIMSRRSGQRIVRAARFNLKPRDQGLSGKKLTKEWLERYSDPNTRMN